MSGAADPGLDDDEPISTINIIPFVDIVLVLLVIFLLTSSVITRAALNLELPKAANAGQITGRVLNVTLTSDGTLLVDGTAVERANLVDTLRARVAGTKDPRAVISADRGTTYQDVIALIDAAKAAGIVSFALNVEWAR